MYYKNTARRDRENNVIACPKPHTSSIYLMIQCSPSEFYSLVKCLSHIHDDLKAFTEMAENDISSELIQQALKEVCIVCAALMY